MIRLKSLLTEQPSTNNTTWEKISDALSVYKNPNILNWKKGTTPMTSLNWGSHKSSKYTWGLSIDSTGTIAFTNTGDDITATDTFVELAKQNGFTLTNEYKDSLRIIDVDYSSISAYNIIQLIKSVLNALE